MSLTGPDLPDDLRRTLTFQILERTLTHWRKQARPTAALLFFAQRDLSQRFDLVLLTGALCGIDLVPPPSRLGRVSSSGCWGRTRSPRLTREPQVWKWRASRPRGRAVPPGGRKPTQWHAHALRSPASAPPRPCCCCCASPCPAAVSIPRRPTSRRRPVAGAR